MTVNHGADIYGLCDSLGVEKHELIDFSSNINPLGASRSAIEHIQSNIGLVSIYPDPLYRNLKEAIAQYCECDTDSIILGSGATQLISSYIDIRMPQRALLCVPVYSEFERELSKRGTEIIRVHAHIEEGESKGESENGLEDKSEDGITFSCDEIITTARRSSCELIVICNPNNPSGFTFTRDEIEFIADNTNAYIMIDETYIEFSDRDVYSSTELTRHNPRLFIIRGTSKFFSTPGLRLGYAITSDRIAMEEFNRRTDLWNINTIAAEMGAIMFKDKEYIDSVLRLMSEEREYLYRELNSINHVKAFRSHSNFILCRIDRESEITADVLRSRLLERGMIIRECSGFDGLNEQWFRICILSHENNEMLISAIKGELNS